MHEKSHSLFLNFLMTALPSTQLLYIIGNGFDLYHRIPSSYTDFGRYVQNCDPHLHALFENYFSFNDNWADFENTLAHLDAGLIIDEASTYLVPYSAENWSDAYHHDYQYEVDRIVSSLSEELKRQFTKWVYGLVIPEHSLCPVPLLDLVLDAKYLTFNYTDTLQKLYGVATTHILHIHNQVTDINSDLVLGHGINPTNIASLNAGADFENQDTRITEANEIIDKYFSRTYKRTNDAISKHQAFFNSLSDVQCICILGHSLSEVDWPYLSLIAENTRLSAPNWIVSYHDKTSIPIMKAAFSHFGVPATKVRYKCITNIHPNT